MKIFKVLITAILTLLIFSCSNSEFNNSMISSFNSNGQISQSTNTSIISSSILNSSSVTSISSENGSFSTNQTSSSVNSTNNSSLDASFYQIAYDLNGGNFLVFPLNQIFKKDLPYKLLNPTKSGYSFSGWFTDSNLTSELIEELNLSNIENMTLYAKWKPINYNISYNLNGGSFEQDVISNYSDNRIPLTLPTPIRNGYIFEGWYLSSNLLGDQVKTIQKNYLTNLLFHAKWTEINFIVMFNSNGGQAYDDLTYSVTNLNFTLPQPEKELFSFQGWFDNPELTGSPILSLKNQSKLKDLQLYAKWKSEVYDLKINSFSDSKKNLVNYESTIKISKDNLPYNILSNFIYNRKYYTLVGFYDNKEFEGSLISVISELKNIELWPKYEAVYKEITLYPQDGVFAEDIPTKISMNEGLINFPKIIRDGFLLRGWYRSSSISNISNLKVEAISAYNEYAHVYYAIWGKKPILTIVSGDITKVIIVDELPYRVYSFAPLGYTAKFSSSRDPYIFNSYNNATIILDLQPIRYFLYTNVNGRRSIYGNFTIDAFEREYFTFPHQNDTETQKFEGWYDNPEFKGKKLEPQNYKEFLKNFINFDIYAKFIDNNN